MHILRLPEIKELISGIDLMPLISDGFVAYSNNQAVIPPVGELVMEDPPGDVHIKYGYIRGHDYYVIKIASGFYQNPSLGLSSSNGLMLLFSQQTGQPVAALLDEGFLTDVRTAVAGAIAAEALAPTSITRIGVIGTGIQARLQLEYLASVTECRDVLVWGRSEGRRKAYVDEMTSRGFAVESTDSLRFVPDTCNLIVTTTPSNTPLIEASWVRPGTHITAMGSDTAEKQELEADLLAKADVVVADSRSQCESRGEIHQAVKCGLLDPETILELGDVISGKARGRTSEDQITVADLTGVAVQDIQIATAVYGATSREKR